MKKRKGKLSDKIKIEIDVKDPFKPKDLSTNLDALEAVIRLLCLHAETKEQHVIILSSLSVYLL